MDRCRLNETLHACPPRLAPDPPYRARAVRAEIRLRRTNRQTERHRPTRAGLLWLEIDLLSFLSINSKMDCTARAFENNVTYYHDSGRTALMLRGAVRRDEVTVGAVVSHIDSPVFGVLSMQLGSMMCKPSARCLKSLLTSSGYDENKQYIVPPESKRNLRRYYLILTSIYNFLS